MEVELRNHMPALLVLGSKPDPIVPARGAFDALGCNVVGLRTDNFNFASQKAIEALGAKKDGVLRHHAMRRDGSARDSVLYSVLAHEWPDVKRHLALRMERNAGRT